MLLFPAQITTMSHQKVCLGQGEDTGTGRLQAIIEWFPWKMGMQSVISLLHVII